MLDLILITMVGGATVACFFVWVHETWKEVSRFRYLMDKWTGRRKEPMTTEEEQEFKKRLEDLAR